MEQDKAVTVKWLSGINMIAGIWLVIAPFVLGFTSTNAYWNEIVIGIIVFALGLYQLAEPRASWAGWLSLVAALWLIASPYMFNPVEAAAYNNAVTTGIIVAILGIASAVTAPVAEMEPTMRHRPM